jgi:hypothetical protein
MTSPLRSLLGALVLAAALVVPAAPALAQAAVTAALAPLRGSNARGTLSVEPPVSGIATLVVEPTGLPPGAARRSRTAGPAPSRQPAARGCSAT